ncbi:MAG: CarD family transcriptional regulator [Bacillota bacterium]|nr:CarD family transcriptional regulator [Bacillota bacterium]
MYKVGEKLLYPMHGAGIVESIEEQELMGEKKTYYVLKMPMDGMKVKIPVDNAKTIGVRDIIGTDEACAVMDYIKTYHGVFNSNWNKRYRENIAHIKSGDVYEVAGVVKMLMCRDKERGLSSGERKMLTSAKQILISEIMLSRDVSIMVVETELEGIIKKSVNL